MTALGKALQNPIAIDSKIIIYVEGNDDVQILEHRWFSEDFNVEFQAAGGNDNRGGCTMVKTAVDSNGASVLPAGQQRLTGFDPDAPPDNAPKFGLVDRDTLYFHAQRNDLFFECDDEVFNQKCANEQPFGPRIRPLRRWEIENYLVANALVVSELLRDLPHPDNANSSYDEAKAADDLLRHGDALIPIVAANLALHTRSKRAIDDNNKFGVHLPDRNAVKTVLGDKLADEVDQDPSLKVEMDAHAAAMDQFNDVLALHTSASRWERLCRIVDGKRLLARLSNPLKKAKDFRLLLARYIKLHNLIDQEFHEHIAYFRQIAAQGL